jgi:Xaa-Pro aminopeptidase
VRQLGVGPARPAAAARFQTVIQPGDMVFLDIMHSFNGYRTVLLPHLHLRQPNKYQIDAYETASKWISASIDMIPPASRPIR